MIIGKMKCSVLIQLWFGFDTELSTYPCVQKICLYCEKEMKDLK